jgi:hypothetical protein
VAVAVSIDLANASALRAFRLSTEAVSGRATHQIVGGLSGLAEDTVSLHAKTNDPEWLSDSARFAARSMANAAQAAFTIFVKGAWAALV